MPLKLRKLEKLFYDNRLIASTIYIKKSGKCAYIKVFSIDNAMTFFISIDSEYNLKIPEEELKSRPNLEIISLEEIKYKEGESTIERYSGYPKDEEIMDQYASELKQETNNEELETSMENGYKQKIFLRDVEKDMDQRLKEIIRQLKRLSLSLQDMHYAVSIVEDKIFTCTKRDRVFSYLANNQKTNGNRMVVIVVALEVLYNLGQKVSEDVGKIKQELLRILDRNSESNFQKLLSLLNTFDKVGETSTAIKTKKQKFDELMHSYQRMLAEIVVSEKTTTDELIQLQGKLESGNINELTFVHAKQKLEDKKSHILEVKQQILKNLNDVLNKRDNLYLKSDKCDFENTILVGTILRNVTEIDSELDKEEN